MRAPGAHPHFNMQMQTTEQQLQFWPKYAKKQIHLQPSNDAGLGLKRFINSTGGVSVPSVSSFYVQGSLPFNLIKIDHGVSLAPSGTWAKQDLTVEREASELIYDLVSEYRESRNLKRLSGKYTTAFDMVLANLLRASQMDQQLIVSLSTSHKVYPHRNPEKISSRTIRAVVMFLAEGDYIALTVGRANEHQNNSSWCVPLPKLITKLEQAKARVMLRSNAPLAELRERATKHRTASGRAIKDKGKPIQLPPSSRERGRLKKLEQPARRHNETWLNHTVTLDDRVLLPWVIRTFTVSTALGGRFYGDYQRIPSDDRKRIRIDGETTVELDFKAMHIAILYAWEGVSLDRDPYIVDGFSRNAVKAVVLPLLNTEHLPSLKAQITRSGKPENQEAYSRYKARLFEYERMTALNLKCEWPNKPIELDHFIEGIPLHTNGGELVNALMDAHPLIKHHFGQKDLGLRLQRVDSDVMASALTLLQGVPVLPIHDSIRCRVSDINRVYDAMAQACSAIVGQPIHISEC